jgi:DnaD/phage-associated family protein
VDYPQIVQAYQNEIGLCTPLIADAINAQLAASIPGEWIVKAIHIAAANEKRSWAYAESIIERWKVEGFDGDMDRKSRRKPAGRAGPNRAGATSKVAKSMDAVDEVMAMIARGETL